MTTLKALIVEDEKGSREFLSNLIANHLPAVKVVGEADSVNGALLKIDETMPDLVFLDIDLAGESGFEVLERCAPFNFEVVFVTAYQEFALKAIKVAAVDYLLKPFFVKELQAAVARVFDKIAQRTAPVAAAAPLAVPDRIALRTLKGFRVVLLNEVLYLEGSGKYTVFHLAGGKKLTVTKGLIEYEAALAAAGFYRTHQSFIVNMKHISEYVSGRGGYLLLANGASIPVAARKREGLLERMAEWMI